MILPAIPGVIHQAHGVVGAGDWDDCAVAAAFWCARYADPKAIIPTVPVFRSRAGNPDDPARPDGLTLDQTIRGSVASWPHLRIAKYQSTDWTALAARLTEGWAANLGIISAELPPDLRFGHSGAHSVGVVVRYGRYLVANPLAPNGSAPLMCPVDDLRRAARKHGNGTILAALYEPLPTTAEDDQMAGDFVIYEPDVESRRRGTAKAGTTFYNDHQLTQRRGAFAKDTVVQIHGYRGDALAIQVTTAQGWADGVSRPTLVFVPKASVTGVSSTPWPAPDARHRVALTVDGIVKWEGDV